ncbi:MAG: hypothetical protein GX992_05995 [Clostridium sp.]|nr:hypothetical protein [Clostridium sp.]
MSKCKCNKSEKDKKNLKDASGKYEFANDQLGENMENKYEDLGKQSRNSKKHRK